jgi:hypothetical protein
MKVTKSYIKQLVKEELTRVLEGKGPEYDRDGKTPAGQDFTLYVRSSNSGEPRYFLFINGEKSGGRYQIGNDMAQKILSGDIPKELDNRFIMGDHEAKEAAFNAYVHNM